MAFYFKIKECTYDQFKFLRGAILEEFPQYLVNDVYDDNVAHIWIHTVPERFNEILLAMGLTAEKVHLG